MAIVSVIVNILILLCHIFIIAHMHTYMQMCLNIGAAAPCCALKCSPSTQLCDIQSSFARVDRNFSKVFNNCVCVCVWFAVFHLLMYFDELKCRRHYCCCCYWADTRCVCYWHSLQILRPKPPPVPRLFCSLKLNFFIRVTFCAYNLPRYLRVTLNCSYYGWLLLLLLSLCDSWPLALNPPMGHI